MFNKLAPVSDIMTTDVRCVPPLTPMQEVADLIREKKIHHVPVVKDGVVHGIISTADLHRLEHHFTLFRTRNAEAINRSILRSMLARDVMKSPVVTINETDTLEKAAGIFRENIFHALPVVNDQNKIVGIITSFDLMNHAFWPEVKSSSTSVS